MKLVEELRDGFASMKTNGARFISTLPDEFKAYIIRIPDGYGVAVKVSEDIEVAERFNSSRLRTGLLSLGGITANYLMLTSAFEEYRYEFASLCAEFVDPGEMGRNRQCVIETPLEWWKNWKELVGNSTREKSVYSVIAEMIVLEHKFKEDPSAEWTATIKGSHDIECEYESCEVKSTCTRYGTSIDIAGQHQLEYRKPLFLYFCRMEKSLEGVSINDMEKRLTDAGYDSGKLENELQHMGFEHGSSIREKKYKVIEKRKYVVDDKFPSITNKSFKDDCIPAGIIQLKYTVDLDVVGYSAW